VQPVPHGEGADIEGGEPAAKDGFAELAALARVSSSQPLSPIADGVAPESRELASTLRVLFGALGMSLNRLAALLHSDPGTVSRYLSGKRVPPPEFIEGLCKAIYDAKGALVTAQARELVHEQFLAALREHNPARYEVQRLTDLLQTAAEEKQQYQVTVTALEEAIASRNEKIYALELEGRRLRSAWARAESQAEEERKQRAHMQDAIEGLFAQVSYFKEQLLAAQQQAAEAEARCQDLEARLDAAGALLQGDHQHETDGYLPTEAQVLPDGPPGIGWWGSYNDVTPSWFQAYLAMEAAANRIRTYETTYIPGLLQTEEYATAVTAMGEFSPWHAAQLVELRKQRQRRFEDGQLTLLVILDESALRRPVAGISAQVDQLRALRAACATPALTLLILPTAAGSVEVPNTFCILEFAEPDLPAVVYVETLTDALYLDKSAAVSSYELAMERLTAAAYQPEESQQIIDRIIADLTQ